MRVAFWKMHGAGNDFVLVDDRCEVLGRPAPEFVEKSCARRTGIGADGLILLGPSKSHDVSLRFFNSDGTEAEMCGNGTRCAALLAYEIGAARRKMVVETGAGGIGAEVFREGVQLQLSPPSEWKPRQSLELDGKEIGFDFINTGVPHVVLDADDLEDLDVQRLGAAVRHHRRLAPQGANVDFMSVRAPGVLSIRTYERGVEDETPACGTGAVACALVAGRSGRAAPPVRVNCASGDVLQVDYRLTAGGAENVRLLGPACHVFRGEFEWSFCPPE